MSEWARDWKKQTETNCSSKVETRRTWPGVGKVGADLKRSIDQGRARHKGQNLAVTGVSGHREQITPYGSQCCGTPQRATAAVQIGPIWPDLSVARTSP